VKETITRYWCDACAADHQQHTAEPVTVPWDGNVIELELCDEHLAPVRAFETLVDTYGRNLTQPPAPIRRRYRKPEHPSTCTTCGREFPNPQGLSAHRRAKHPQP
jgi:hypothetical protein